MTCTDIANCRPMPRTRGKRVHRGVALIEVMVAVLILSLGILGLVGLQASAIGMSGEADDRSRAAMLADEAISAMWARRSVSLSEDELTAWEEVVQAQLPNAEGAVQAVAGRTDAADISITWKPHASKTSEESRALKTRIYLPVVPLGGASSSSGGSSGEGEAEPESGSQSSGEGNP